MPEFELPLVEWINAGADRILDAISPFFYTLGENLGDGMEAIENVLLILPFWGLVLIVALLVWRLADWRLAVFGAFSLLLMWAVGFWEETVETIALVLVATSLTILVGVPLGILAAWSNSFDRALRPILDFMQTLPSFVYLIPAVILFGLGKVAALVATLIFAVPPPIRLTNLGIREVEQEMVEASHSFGATRWQTLLKVQIPAAMPTIMTGINQAIMLSLSMAVVAAMIGAQGLGGVVLRAIQRIDIGLGLVGGIGIVFLAILIDRTVQRLGS